MTSETTLRIGTIGSGGCRVTEVSGLASNVGQTIRLPSGVQVRIDQNGTYRCQIPRRLESDRSEVFDLVSLSVVEGQQQKTGQLTIQNATTFKEPVVRHSDETKETVIHLQTVTNKTLTVDPRRFIEGARVDAEVTLLQMAEAGESRLTEKGELQFLPAPDFVGIATIKCLVEAENRKAAFVKLLIDVERSIRVSTNIQSTGDLDHVAGHRFEIIVGGPEVSLCGTALADSRVQGRILNSDGLVIAASIATADASGLWKLLLPVKGWCQQTVVLQVSETNQIAGRFGGFTVQPESLTGATVHPVS